MDNIVVLNDNDGNELEFEYLDLIEHNEETYVVLLPVDDEADEVVILRCEESEDDSDEEMKDLKPTEVEKLKKKYDEVNFFLEN